MNSVTLARQPDVLLLSPKLLKSSSQGGGSRRDIGSIIRVSESLHRIEAQRAKTTYHFGLRSSPETNLFRGTNEVNKEGSTNLIGLKGPIFERRARQLECCSKRYKCFSRQLH